MAKLSIRQPLLFVTLFALLLMGVLLYMQQQSDSSIKDMQYGNQTASVTFKANNSLQEIINGINVIENAFRKNSPENYTRLEKSVKDTMALIQKEVDFLKQISGNTALTIQLNNHIASKFDLYNNILNSRADISKIKLLLNSVTNNELNDNIYANAQNIQLQLENNLQQTLEKNTQVSAKVLRLGRALTISALAAILLLGTLIISHLKKNIALLNDLETEKTKTQEAANIKEQFLANMSHEIRTPVNAITGFTNLLDKTPLNPNQKEYVGLIKSASNNLYEIVNDILDISKIEAGMLQIDKAPFSLKELLYELELLFTHMAKTKGLVFNCNIHKDVPEYVLGDSERLKQVFINLISNAIKFTPKGIVSITVKQKSNTHNQSIIEFIVKDSGIGIPENKLHSIFERFEQADSETTRHFGGTGLGLAIAKKLVLMHDGTIDVKSIMGQGTEFTVTMPFEIAPVESSGLQSTELSMSKKHPQPQITFSNQCRVLAAEDNMMNQLLLRYIFEQWQLPLTIVKNGLEAITELKQQNYQLILMDIQMPEMDGFETVYELRNTLKLNTPVVAMTAHTLPGEKEKCLEAGMNDYLPKPLIENELIAVLNKFLPQKKSGEEKYINQQELNSLFDHNKDFVNNILTVFAEQFPKEVDALETAVKGQDYKKARSIAHNMKTTVTSVNSKSPLVACLEIIEEAEDKNFNDKLIIDAVATILSNRQSVVKEAQNSLDSLEKNILNG